MAGSYKHVTTKSGRLRNDESFCGQIENLGDAYEAVKELYGMIWWLAAARLRTPVNGYREPRREALLSLIEEARDDYKDGLRMGGVQKSS